MKSSEIANLRLYNQGLSKTTFKDPIDAVTQLGAVQAQDYAGAKWALGQRLVGYTDAALDKVFNKGKLLRTHILRPTWHFVTPADIHWMLLISAPRVHAISAYYYRQAGLDSTMVKRTNAVITKVLRGGNQLTRTEITSALEKAGVSTDVELRMTLIMMRAELDGIICSGARRGKQFTYALLEERAPQVKVWKREEALAELVKRYFKTRGPATLQDFTWWSGLTMADAKNGMEMVKSEFASENINGQTYWFPQNKVLPSKKPLTGYLLPNYDEYFIGFKDRSAIGEVAGMANLPANDPTLIANVIVLNGQVVGGWKRALKKDSVTIELKPIIKLAKNEKEAVEHAAKGFGGFLRINPNNYLEIEVIMEMKNIPFGLTDWAKIIPTEHKGETGMAIWRTQQFDNIRVRMVEYSAGYLANHWCEKGHILLCIEGKLHTELADGRKFVLTPGVSYQVADNAEPHRSHTKVGAKLFIVD